MSFASYSGSSRWSFLRVSALRGDYIYKYAIFGTAESEMVKNLHAKVNISRSALCMEMLFCIKIQCTLINRSVAGIMIGRCILSFVNSNVRIGFDPRKVYVYIIQTHTHTHTHTHRERQRERERERERDINTYLESNPRREKRQEGDFRVNKLR